MKTKFKSIGALVGHPRSGTSYFKRVVNYASAVRPAFSHCYGALVGRWDQKQTYADRFVFDCDCPKNRVVLLERDARDICVSAWYFMRYRIGDEGIGTEQEFVDRVIPFITNWQTGARAFVPPERRVQFKEMTKVETLLRALKLMGAKPKSSKSVQRAVTGLSFQNLQQRDKGGFYSKAGNHYEESGNDIRSLSFRSGKSGSWRNFPADFSEWRTVDETG